MAVDEQARHALYQQAEAAMGSDSAETLMALLPPVGWADVATKHDVAHLAQLMETRFDASEQRVLQTMTWRLVQMLVAVVGIVLAVIVPFVA